MLECKPLPAVVCPPLLPLEKAVKITLHFLRPSGFQVTHLAAIGMREPDLGRMQCESWRMADVGHRSRSQRASIDWVTADGMSKLRQVDADLVRPPGFQAAFDFAQTAPVVCCWKGSKGRDVRHCNLSLTVWVTAS